MPIIDTTVVNMRVSAYDIRIDRESIFGNPFRLGVDGNRDAVLEKYRIWFLKRVDTDQAFRDQVLALRGKRLGCWCAGVGICHGMVIVEWLERTTA